MIRLLVWFLNRITVFYGCYKGLHHLISNLIPFYRFFGVSSHIMLIALYQGSCIVSSMIFPAYQNVAKDKFLDLNHVKFANVVAEARLSCSSIFYEQVTICLLCTLWSCFIILLLTFWSCFILLYLFLQWIVLKVRSRIEYWPDLVYNEIYLFWIKWMMGLIWYLYSRKGN